MRQDAAKGGAKAAGLKIAELKKRTGEVGPGVDVGLVGELEAAEAELTHWLAWESDRTLARLRAEAHEADELSGMKQRLAAQVEELEAVRQGLLSPWFNFGDHRPIDTPNVVPIGSAAAEEYWAGGEEVGAHRFAAAPPRAAEPPSTLREFLRESEAGTDEAEAAGDELEQMKARFEEQVEASRSLLGGLTAKHKAEELEEARLLAEEERLRAEAEAAAAAEREAVALRLLEKQIQETEALVELLHKQRDTLSVAHAGERVRQEASLDAHIVDATAELGRLVGLY